MDSMAATVVKQEDLLARNIVSAEMLIEDNTKSIENLVGIISFIEATQKKLVRVPRLFKMRWHNRYCHSRLPNQITELPAGSGARKTSIPPIDETSRYDRLNTQI